MVKKMETSKYTLEDVVNFLTKIAELDELYKTYAARKNFVIQFLSHNIYSPQQLSATYQISLVEDVYVKYDFDDYIAVFKVQMDDENHVFLKITGEEKSYYDGSTDIDWNELELVQPITVSCTTYI